MNSAYVQCMQAIAQFYYGLDTFNYDTLLAGIDVDTTWHRQGKALTGPEAIRQALSERNVNRKTFHQTSNFRLEQSDSTNVTINYALTVFDNQGADGGLQLKTVMFSTDHFALRQGQWRLLEKRSKKYL